jgi:chaperonin cofactor prefoldin
LEVADRESLAKDLKNTIETLSEHSNRLSQQETTLRGQYEEIVKQFEG